ncbi:MAG: MFS transporter, partial [Eubacteriales bacterium]
MGEKIRNTKNPRWIIWSILCLVYIIVFFHRSAVGVVKVDLMKTFNISGSTFANLSSAYFYAYMIMQIPTGMLVDTLGVRITVTVGTILAGLGSILFGFSPTLYVAFLGRIMVGIGVSVVFISILKIQTQWFLEKEFATMSGLTAFLGNLGGVLAQTPLVILVSVITWRYSFMMIGLVTIIMAALCFKIIRNTPADIGLPPIDKAGEKTAQGEKVNILNGLFEVCRNPHTWPPFFMFAGFYGAFQAFSGTWGHSYLTTVYGMNNVKAANYIAIAVLGFCTASVLLGRLSDKILKRKVPMIAFGTIYLISWVVMVFFKEGRPPVGILGILLFTMGFSSAVFVLGWACGKEVNNPKYAGISTSVINTGGFIGAAIVPVVIGRVI